jgi:hypothetical protein
VTIWYQDAQVLPPCRRHGFVTETMITTEYLAMRFGCLIELLRDCLGVTVDGGDSGILLATDGAGDSSASRIVEGGDLPDDGGGEGVGALLAAKGGGCNLDAGVMNSTCIHMRAKRLNIYMYRRGRIYKEPPGEIQ